jgi:hypothetical protein
MAEASTFSREDLLNYEKGPQTQVPADKNPFEGARKAGVADPAAIAAVAAGKVDATPGAKPGREAVATPSGDSDVVITEDQPVVGDGASDETADSSTASDDPGADIETKDEAAKTGDEEPVKPAPKKGSAAERIVEVLDLAEGYKEYGKLKSEQVKELEAEIARLKAATAPKTAPATTTAANEVDEPMPDMSDPDVNFDADKLKAKTTKWIKAQVAAGTRTAIREATGADAVAKTLASVDSKVQDFAKTHDDFDTVVTKNRVLLDNQLSIDASVAVAESEYTAELLYHFGKNPGLAIKTAKSTPAQQLLTIGRLIESIDAQKKAAASKTPQPDAKAGTKKSITQATPPPTPVRGAGKGQERDITDPGMDMEEFARKHRAEKQAARERNRTGRRS